MIALCLTVAVMICGAAACLYALASGYSRAVKSGTATISAAREFDRLFPGATHSLSYYTGTYGDPRWNSKVGLYGRYVLTMQVPVALGGFGRGRVVSHGEPAFYLQEVRSVETLPDGRKSITYDGGNELSFGPAEWRKVVEARGDLRVLGVAIKENEPVSGFVAN